LVDIIELKLYIGPGGYLHINRSEELNGIKRIEPSIVTRKVCDEQGLLKLTDSIISFIREREDAN